MEAESTWENATPEQVRGDFPWFRFYASVWGNDRYILSYSMKQRGFYFSLLCACWADQDCGIDLKPASIRNRFGIKTDTKWNQIVIKKHFVPHPYLDGIYTNKRLIIERMESVRIYNIKVKGGESTRKKWEETQAHALADAIAEALAVAKAQEGANRIDKNRIDKKDHLNIEKIKKYRLRGGEKIEAAIVRRFEICWKFWENKQGKVRALAKYKKHYLKDGYFHHVRMIRAMRQYEDLMRAEHRTGFQQRQWQHGSTFFNNGWVDFYKPRRGAFQMVRTRGQN